jgi:hypothetical protein
MYGFTQDLPITAATWFTLKEAIGTDPVEGLLVHAVVREGSGLRYIDLWESREACDRFLDERVHPVLGGVFAASGGELPAEPDRHEFDVVDLAISPSR